MGMTVPPIDEVSAWSFKVVRGAADLPGYGPPREELK
jgi:hypothetical protein